MKLWPGTPCERVRDRASAFLDGRLAAAARADVQRHLHACAACMLELQQLARLSRAMHNLPPFRLADGMAPRLRRQLAAAPAATARPPQQHLARRAVAFAAAVAAAAVVFWLGFLCGSRGTGAPPPSPPRTAAPEPSIAAPAPAPRPQEHTLQVPALAPQLVPRRGAAPAPNAQFASFDEAAPPPPRRRTVPDARELLDEMLREMLGDERREPPHR